MESRVRTANGIGKVRVRVADPAPQLLTRGQRDRQYREFRAAHDAEIGDSHADQARRCVGTRQDAGPVTVLKPGYRRCSYRRSYVRDFRSPYDPV